jgi:Uma2 family endonuclease
MSDAARKLDHPPTLADIDALPPHMKGEILDGVFYAMTRPRGVHQNVAGEVAAALRPPFQRGRGGPGGWIILPEPGIALPSAPEVSPDLAGWRRTRLPSVPSDRAIALVPDWVCEVLSHNTRRYDQHIKKPFYARVGVGALWIVDTDAQVVTASLLDNGRWVEVGVWSDETDARIPPFDEVPLNVGEWWDDAETSASEP